MDRLSALFWVVVALLLLQVIVLPIHWAFKPVIIIGSWFFIVFVISRLVVPGLGFRKKPLPQELSPSLQRAVDSISGSELERTRKAYDIIIARYQNTSGKTLFRLETFFWHDPLAEWTKKGYSSCAKMNYYLRLLLVKSGTYDENQIRLKITPYRYNIHQYVEITTPKGKIVLDPNYHYAHIPFARKNDYWWRRGVNEHKYKGVYRLYS